MTPMELAKRLMRGERWSVKQEPTKVEVRLTNEEIAKCVNALHARAVAIEKLKAAKVPVVPNIFDDLRVERGVLTQTTDQLTGDIVFTWVGES